MMKEENLDILRSLMEELIEEMKPGASDFEERLGRPKPDVAVMKVEAGPGMGEDDASPMAVSDHDDMGSGDEDEDFKQRLMKLRA